MQLSFRQQKSGEKEDGEKKSIVEKKLRCEIDFLPLQELSLFALNKMPQVYNYYQKDQIKKCLWILEREKKNETNALHEDFGIAC
jgi:hypothetical protein